MRKYPGLDADVNVRSSDAVSGEQYEGDWISRLVGSVTGGFVARRIEALALLWEQERHRWSGVLRVPHETKALRCDH